MNISGATKLYCLLGNPVAHSLSPFIMNRAFELMAIGAVYVATPVVPHRLGDAVSGLRAMGAGGANVTYPHKGAVLSHVDHCSQSALLLQAANTLHFTDDGIHAHNTDARGATLALEEIAGVSLRDKRVLVFGAGGAARATAWGVLEAGASGVVFCVRDTERVRPLLGGLREAHGDEAIDLLPAYDPRGPEAMRRTIAAADILINATPVGMSSSQASAGFPLIDDATWIEPTHVCFDLVYGPAQTPFLAMAQARGARRLTGRSMLVGQAVEAFRIWTGKHFDVKEMAAAVEKAHNRSSLAHGGK